MLAIRRIYLDPNVRTFSRGREVLAKFPHAELIEVASHQDIPGLYGNAGQVDDWVKNKREVLVLGEKRSLQARANGRSADFIAPSTSNGCAMACTYCYVPRRKGYANPITVFVNIERIIGYLERHIARQGPKTTPNQCDPTDWVYDLGENGDCSVDALISDNVQDLVELFARTPGAKASFATKFVNRALLEWEPRGSTRVRFSIMPRDMSRRLDLRTTPVADRLAAVNDFVAAGYEVHLNFSPVVLHEGWYGEWQELLREAADVLNDQAKAQLACEIIMLTHNVDLHQVNLGWHSQGEELLWRPDLQEKKVSHSGQENLRYRARWKQRWVDQLIDLVKTELPTCRIRYAF